MLSEGPSNCCDFHWLTHMIHFAVFRSYIGRRETSLAKTTSLLCKQTKNSRRRAGVREVLANARDEWELGRVVTLIRFQC